VTSPTSHDSNESLLASTEATDASDPAASLKILALLPSASQDHRDSSSAARQESVVPAAFLDEETTGAAVPPAIQNQISLTPVEQDTVAATSLPSTVASATSEDSVSVALTAGSGSETVRGEIIPAAPANSQEYEPVNQNVVGPSKELSSSVSMTSPAPVSKKRKPSLPKDPNAPKRPMR
jgi:hypothetical protein